MPVVDLLLVLVALAGLRQEEELQARKAKITELGIQVASEGRQRTEERRGRTEAERRLRAEKQVRADIESCRSTVEVLVHLRTAERVAAVGLG